MTDPATQKQIDYIIDLGGSVSKGLTKNDASTLIQQLLEDNALRKKQELQNRNRNARTTRIRNIDPTGVTYHRKSHTTEATPPKDDNKGGCLGLVIIIGLIIGGLYLFYSYTDSGGNDNNATVISNNNNESGEMVYISRYGDCYHYDADCIALANINAYVEVYKCSLSSATNSHRLCEICRRNAGF